MSEVFDKLFSVKQAAGLAILALALGAALYLLSRGAMLEGAVICGVTYFAFRGFWRSTLRNRALARRGYHVGSRIGSHWVYEELHSDLIESIEFPVEYVGRGEYDIHIPGERDWSAAVPAWARERREQIVGRLGSVFKRSQMHFDADSSPGAGNEAGNR